jgi:hypothetical protein
MARKKRTSKVLDKALKRADGLKTIDPVLDLGGVTLAEFSGRISKLTTDMSQYNTLMTQLDTMTNDLKAQEKALAEYSNRMLSGVATRFGKDSNQYEAAGGVRKSERKKPVRAPKTG